MKSTVEKSSSAAVKTPPSRPFFSKPGKGNFFSKKSDDSNQFFKVASAEKTDEPQTIPSKPLSKPVVAAPVAPVKSKPAVPADQPIQVGPPATQDKISEQSQPAPTPSLPFFIRTAALPKKSETEEPTQPAKPMPGPAPTSKDAAPEAQKEQKQTGEALPVLKTTPIQEPAKEQKAYPAPEEPEKTMAEKEPVEATATEKPAVDAKTTEKESPKTPVKSIPEKAKTEPGQAEAKTDGVSAPKTTTEAAPKPQLDASDSQSLLNSLASSSPTAFVQGVKQSGSLVPSVQQKEKDALAENMPEIEQPTGIPVKGEQTGEKEKIGFPKEKAPEAQLNDRKGGEKIDVKHDQTVEKARVATIPTPKARGEDDPNFVNNIKHAINNLPTQDEEVNTSAGERPKVDLSREADPAQNENNQALFAEEVNAEQNKADTAIYRDFGENDIYPDIKKEVLRPSTALSPIPAAPATESLEDLPATTGEVYASFDAQAKASMDKQIQVEMAKNEVERQKMEEESVKEREDGQRKIDEETEKVKNQQIKAQDEARSEVEGHRKDWKAENEQVKQDYADKSEAKKKETDQQIDTEVRQTDEKVDTELKRAESEAEKEKRKTEEEAERKKREAENKEPSFWDKVTGAISDFFDKLKEGLNMLFDGLRKLVKGIIELAKKAVNEFIELARKAIVGFIKAFGEALKAFVNIALAAFPEIAEKINGLIDKAVNAAVDVVNALAEGLKKIASAILDAIGAVLDAILAAYQAFYNFLLDALKFIAVGIIKILRGIANLVQAAYESPDHFWAQVSVELIGQDITNPLPNEVGYVKEKDETQIGSGFETIEHTKSLLGIKSDEEKAPDQVSSNSEDLKTEDFVNPEVDHNFTLSPELGALVSSLDENGETEFGHAPENDNVFESHAEAAPTGQPAVQSSMTGAVSTPQAEAPVETSGPKVGPFKNAWERGQHVLNQIKEGISKWWEKNKVNVIAGLVLALAAGIILEIVTGGAITAAIPVLLDIIAVLFAAQDIIDAGIFIGQYLTKSWVGAIAFGAMSLARAFVKIIMAFIFDLIGGGEILKGIKSGIKAAEKGGVKGALAFGKNVVKNVAVKQAKNFAKLGNIAKAGASTALKNGKMVLSGIKGGLKAGAKSLDELAKGLLSRFRFRRFKFVRKGFRFYLFGEINPWVLLASGDLKHVDADKVKGLKVGDDFEKGILIGIREGDDASKLVKQLRKPGSKPEAADLFKKLEKTTPDKRSSIIFGGKNTKELRKGITGLQPKDFQAHHIIPEELIDEFDDFFKKMNFNPQDGAKNGIMVPPDKGVLKARMKDPEVAKQFENSAFHLGSHPDYTIKVKTRLREIKNLLDKKLITKGEALEDFNDLISSIRSSIQNGKGKTINQLNF